MLGSFNCFMKYNQIETVRNFDLRLSTCTASRKLLCLLHFQHRQASRFHCQASSQITIINTATCTLMSKFRPLLLFLQKYTNPTPANKFVKLIVKKSINSCGNVCLSMHTLRVSQIHRKQPPATHRLQEAYHQLLTTEATRSYISSVVRSDANFQYILQSIPSSTMWRLSDD